MKKILLVVLLIFMTGSFAFGGVEKKYDDFDGTLTVVSNVNRFTSPWVGVLFQKMQHRSKKISCSLSLFRAEASRYWAFSATPIAIKVKSKIDKEAKEKIFEASNDDTTIHQGYISCGRWLISDELQKEILNASDVTIRVYSTNSPAETWSVPEKILNEWKEVLRVFAEEINKQEQKVKEAAEKGF